MTEVSTVKEFLRYFRVRIMSIHSFTATFYFPTTKGNFHDFFSALRFPVVPRFEQSRIFVEFDVFSYKVFKYEF